MPACPMCRMVVAPGVEYCPNDGALIGIPAHPISQPVEPIDVSQLLVAEGDALPLPQQAPAVSADPQVTQPSPRPVTAPSAKAAPSAQQPETSGDSAASAPSDDSEAGSLRSPGTVLGVYKLISLLGSGGMGNVYLAEHVRLNRKVALKLLHPEYARDPKAVTRFFNEARAVNQIAHENIVEISDFFDDGEDKYYIMEFLEGTTLEDVQRDGVLPLPRAINIIAQSASALAAVHDAGIVHRDLKPANIFLTEKAGKEDYVKLLDFGVAKLTDTSGKSLQQTADYAILGTPEYMSPEHLGGSGLDHRTDIYALGVIMYEIVTGQKPFSGTSFGELVIKHTTMPPPRLDELDNLPQWVPQDLEDLILRCLAKDPDHRPQHMAEIEARLRELEEALPVEIKTMKPRRRRPKRTKLYAGVAAAAAMLLLGAGVGFAMLGADEQAELAAAAAAEPALPATVRITFASEPTGAGVFAQNSEKRIGLTPFSSEFDRSETPAMFQFRRQGHERTDLAVSLTKDAQVNVTLAKTKTVKKRRRERRKKKLHRTGVLDPFGD